MIGALLRPLRRRRAVKALSAYSEAKDAYRRAYVRGDARKMHEALPALQAALNEHLAAENKLRRAS